MKINDEKPRPPRIKKFKRLSRSTPKPRTTTVKNTLLTNKNDQKMAFVVRNSFSFGPNSIQVGVPESTEVVEDNSIVIGKPMKEDGKLLFFLIYFVLGQIHLPLMDKPYVKCVIKKNFFVFHCNSMKLSEVLVQIDNYN